MGTCIKSSEFNELVHRIISGPYSSLGQCEGGCGLGPLSNGDFNLPSSSGVCSGLRLEPLQRELAAPPWYVDNNCSTYSYCDAAVPGYQENRFVGFNWSTNLCSVQQAIQTEAGNTYSCSFDMGNQPGYNGSGPLGVPDPVNRRYLEVVVYGLTAAELNSIASTGNFSNIIHQEIFSIPTMNVPNAYEGLGWETKTFSFIAATNATMIRFRTVDTRVGSPTNGGANVVLDNVSIQ